MDDSGKGFLHNRPMNLSQLDDGIKLRTHLLKVVSLSFFLCVLIAVSVDQILSIFFARGDLQPLWLAARNITNIGLSEFYFGGAAICFIFFKWMAARTSFWKSREDRRSFLQRWAVNGIAAMLGCGIVLHIIKFSVGRQRPHKSAPFYDPLVFEPFTTHWHWHSFPSGHSQTMFTVATMLSLAWPRYRWFWLGFATIICFTRVIVHDHFLSDVIFGAVEGYAMTLVTLFLMRKYTRYGL